MHVCRFADRRFRRQEYGSLWKFLAEPQLTASKGAGTPAIQPQEMEFYRAWKSWKQILAQNLHRRASFNHNLDFSLVRLWTENPGQPAHIIPDLQSRVLICLHVCASLLCNGRKCIQAVYFIVLDDNYTHIFTTLGKTRDRVGDFSSGCTSKSCGEHFKNTEVWAHPWDADLIDLIVLGCGPGIGMFEKLPRWF